MASAGTSPRVRLEVDRAKRGRVRGLLHKPALAKWSSIQRSDSRKGPLTPTLSPHAGRGRRRLPRVAQPLGADSRERAVELDLVDPDVDIVEQRLIVASQQHGDV